MDGSEEDAEGGLGFGEEGVRCHAGPGRIYTRDVRRGTGGVTT